MDFIVVLGNSHTTIANIYDTKYYESSSDDECDVTFG